MTPDLPAVEVAIIEMTNAFRSDHRLGALRRNPQLDRAAADYARFLARTGRFSHTADGRRVAERTTAAGYRHCRVSENLALNLDSRGFRSRDLAANVVTGWKNSPAHRTAMIDPHVVEIGVSVIKAPAEHRYISVQLFGRPYAQRLQFVVVNAAPQGIRYLRMGRPFTVPPRGTVTETSCEPVRLVFENASKADGPADVAADYVARDGDRFIVKSRTGGELVVVYSPKTR